MTMMSRSFLPLRTPPLAWLTHRHPYGTYFRPRPLDNLAVADEIESLDPILDSKVMNLLPNSDTPQIFAACGRGHAVEESVSSDLPGIPNAVWTTKKKEDDEYDSYIILSFVNGTLVLSIGETIEEVQDTGFLSSAPTLAVQQIGADALLQVHPQGIRHVLSDRRVNEWRVPQGKTIVTATTNKRQVVVALSSAELVYFELDLDGQLNEYQDRKAMGSTVLALSIGEVPDGRQRTPYLAVGCEDQTVRIISLDPDNTLETISLQALTAHPPLSSQPTMFVNIGLQNGVLLRTVLDPINGQLTDTRTRYTRSSADTKEPAILALSSRSWLNYTHQNLMHFTPIIFDNLDYAWSFSAELSPEGLIGISGSVLRSVLLKSLLYVSDRGHQSTPEVFGRPRALAGLWGSCIRIIDPIKVVSAFLLLPSSLTLVCGELHLVVGTAVDTTLSPRSCTTGYLRTYKFNEDGTGLELLHKGVSWIFARHGVPGRLVAGVGKALRIYDIGKKKLLRKVENKSFGSAIVTLNTQGSRILVVYKAPENRLLIFADDYQPRWVSATAMVDYNTVWQATVSEQVDDDPTGAGILHEKGILMGAPHKTSMIAHFHVGDLVTSIHKVSLVAGGRELLLYTGIHGTIGVLVPFHMRTEQSSLVGRDQLSWRGYYVPVKCHCGELDRTVGEVLKKLEQLRVTASGF
ncbi:pre-mRNA-splicing factor rse [Salix suchowensis]|nr:pre-mRNA-splicing factor rse [Salix suchowensis]